MTHLYPLWSAITFAPRVLLDEELWRSLAALDRADEVPWVHGCVLEHGHRGDHRALAYRAGALSYWLQWDEGHGPRFSTTDRPDPLERRPAHGVNHGPHNMQSGRPWPSTRRQRPLNPVQRTRDPKPKRCVRSPLRCNA